MRSDYSNQVIKPLHTKWLAEQYNHISFEAGTKVIVNEFNLDGIHDAIRSGKSILQSIEPFHDIARLANSFSEGNPGTFVPLSDGLREGYVNELDENESEDNEDTKWGLEDNFNINAFEDFIIDDE